MINSFKRGAYDYLIKSWKLNTLAMPSCGGARGHRLIQIFPPQRETGAQETKLYRSDEGTTRACHYDQVLSKAKHLGQYMGKSGVLERERNHHRSLGVLGRPSRSARGIAREKVLGGNFACGMVLPFSLFYNSFQ
jgi:hypothetical protein